MTLALDTDVVVHWMMAGAPRHTAARRLVEAEVKKRHGTLGIVPQVLHEFLHVTTDPRRFEHPLSMAEALGRARALWDARETLRIVPSITAFHRTVDLLETLELGRKRILDTALAATLEAAGIRRLATFNGDDFAVFSFLDVVEPR